MAGQLDVALAELVAEQRDVDAALAQLEDRRRLLEVAIAALGDLGVTAATAVVEVVIKMPKPRDRSDRNTGRRPGPVSDKPDYPVIAAEVKRMRIAGEQVGPGLAAKFGVPLSTSKNWMNRCVKLGLLTPLTKPAPQAVASAGRVATSVSPRNGSSPADDTPVELPPDIGPDLVALTYLQAVRDNRRPIQAVMDAYDCSKPSAVALIARARDAGALPPAGEPQLPEDERRELLGDVPAAGLNHRRLTP